MKNKFSYLLRDSISIFRHKYMKTLENAIYKIKQKFQKKVYDLPYVLKRKEKRMLETKKKHIQEKLEREKKRKIAQYNRQQAYEIDQVRRKYAEEWNWPKVKTKPKKKPTMTTSKFKQKLLTKLQYFSRLRDTDENWIWHCISCWKVWHFRTLQWWHFMSRRFLTTAFDLQNINAQCRHCNAPTSKWWLNWNAEWYKIWLYNKYWKWVWQDLEKRSKGLGSISMERMTQRMWEVLEMIERYKSEKNEECFIKPQ